MNQFLADRVQRKLETLSDERVYQVLDYIEFLESRYAERKPAPPGVFQRFAEGVEDTMRAGKVSATAVAETMSLLSKAMGVLNGVAAAGKSVASDLASVGSAPRESPPREGPPLAGASGGPTGVPAPDTGPPKAHGS